MAEEAQERSLRVFRHEAGTPLAVIGGALRQLDRTQLSAEQRDLVDSAHRQWEVLQRLLDQLVVADDAVELTLRRERLDVVELVRDLVHDLADTVLADHPCHVDVVQEDLVVDGDPVRLRQVLFNLLDNAAKFSPDGTTVHVTVGREGDAVVLAVTDEGSGVSAPDAVRIFERYERASTDVEGLGLGLYVVWRVVQAHGGEVSAEPAPEGAGARFVVRLPGVGGSPAVGP